MGWRVCILDIVLAAGCVKTAAYQCGVAADCGPTGACVAAADGRSYCAAPADDCSGGLRFSASAGAYAGECVEGTGDGDGPVASSPGACFVGDRLPRVAATCTARVCDQLSSCCETSWTRACVRLAEVECDLACGARVAWAGDGQVEVTDFASGAPGTVVATAAPSYGTAGQAYRSSYWLDIDRDGQPELVAATATGSVGGDEQLVLRASGTGWTILRDLRQLDLTGYDGFDVAAGDYDRDGTIDLALAGGSPGVVLFHGDTRPPPFVAGAAVPPEIANYFTSSIDMGDFDNDGDDDLAILDYNDGTGKVLRWTGAAFEGNATAPSFGTTVTKRRVSFGDVDGDRDLDVAVVGGTQARVLRNDAGVLTPLWSFDRAGSDFSEAAWIDADGDRDQDLVLGDLGFGGGTLLMFANTGATLDDREIYTSVDREDVWRIAVGDIDGDGDLDLALAEEVKPNRIYLNDGNMGFVVGWTAPVARKTFGVAVTRP